MFKVHAMRENVARAHCNDKLLLGKHGGIGLRRMKLASSGLVAFERALPMSLLHVSSRLRIYSKLSSMSGTEKARDLL